MTFRPVNGALRLMCVLVWLPVLASCGERMAPSEGNSESGLSVEAARNEINQAFETWSGSRVDRQAAAILTAYEDNGEYSKCMYKSGWDVPWQDAVYVVGEPTDPLGDNVVLLDPEKTKHLIAESLIAEKVTAQKEERLNREPGEKEFEAGQVCLKSSTRREANVGSPAQLEELEMAWTKFVRDRTLPITGDADQFASCVLRNLGEKPKDKQDYATTFWFLDEQIRRLAPPATERPVDIAANASPAWNKVLIAEAELRAAEGECARPSYAQAVLAVHQDLDVFTQEHEAEIAQLESHWSDVRNQVNDLARTQSVGVPWPMG